MVVLECVRSIGGIVQNRALMRISSACNFLGTNTRTQFNLLLLQGNMDEFQFDGICSRYIMQRL